MKWLLFFLLQLSIINSVLAKEVGSVAEMFTEADVEGLIRYYYIETNKNKTTSTSSAHANSVGGHLKFNTASLYGVSGGLNFMSTNPFLLPVNSANVDTSIIGRDNGVRLEGSPTAKIATKGYSVLGESYIAYKRNNWYGWAGRKAVSTPFIHTKEVRMIPSTIQGYEVGLAPSYGWQAHIGYINFFKQRTSATFVNMIEHALGADAQRITKSSTGFVVPLMVGWKNDHASVALYDYYASNFFNTFYAEAKVRRHIDETWTYAVKLQAISQQSVGNANDYFEQNRSYAGGKIASTAFGTYVDIKNDSTALSMAVTKVLRNDDEHDDLVMPYDGTPLYTNTITSNDLFSSNYGKGLTSSANYIGGTLGAKISYTQQYDLFGKSALRSVIAIARYKSDVIGFDKPQEDLNIVLGYKKSSFDVALKGIFVAHNTVANANGTVQQIDHLTQYRVIAQYKF